MAHLSDKWNAKWSASITAAAVAMIALNTFTNSYFQHIRWPDDFPRYQDTLSVVKAGVNVHGLDKQSLENGVVIFTPDGAGSWERAPSGQRSGFDFLIKDVADSAQKRKCLAVFFNNGESDLSETIARDIIASEFKKTIPVVSVGSVTKSERLLMMDFETQIGNCPRTYNNRYIPTQEERQLEDARKNTASEVSVLPVQSSAEIGRFAFTLGPEPSIDALIKIFRDGDGIAAEIHSQQLRGYDGISSFELKDPALIFRPKDKPATEVFRTSFYEGWFGGGHPAITPWRSPKFHPADGVYDIVFHVSSLRNPHGKEQKPFEVVLSTITWPMK